MKKLFGIVFGVVVLFAAIAVIQYLFFPIDEQRAVAIGQKEFDRICLQLHLAPEVFQGPEIHKPEAKYDYYGLTWRTLRNGENFEVYVRVNRRGHPAVTYKGNIQSVK